MLAVVCSGAAMAQATMAQRMIDLTHTFDAKTIYWPTEDGFKLLRGGGGGDGAGLLLRGQSVHVCRAWRDAHRCADPFLRGRADGRSVAARSAGRPGGVRGCVAEVRGGSRLSGDRRRLRGLGEGQQCVAGGSNRAHSHRLRPLLAGPREVPGHGRARQGGGGEVAISRVSIRRRPIGW